MSGVCKPEHWQEQTHKKAILVQRLNGVEENKHVSNCKI